jgi:hypothetical protein
MLFVWFGWNDQFAPFSNRTFSGGFCLSVHEYLRLPYCYGPTVDVTPSMYAHHRQLKMRRWCSGFTAGATKAM